METDQDRPPRSLLLILPITRSGLIKFIWSVV